MMQVSIERYFGIDCILPSEEVLSFPYHTYQGWNYIIKVTVKTLA